MPTGSRTWRTWSIAAAVILVLLILFLPNTPIQSKSKEYLGKAWGSITGSPSPASEEAAEFGGVEPTEPEPESNSGKDSGKEGEIYSDEGTVQMEWVDKNEDGYNFDKWYYQFDIEHLHHPKYDIETLKHLAPHNYKGPGNPAFATFFATRSSSIQDPYFMSTVQNIYRLLWDPRSRSNQYPFIVFVAPFVTQQQRDIFAAGGAIVRQLDLVPFHPEHKEDGGGVAGRLIDMFSKLEMWKQTDFSLINYMDSDAYALENIDRIFDLAPPQRCNVDRLLPADHNADGAAMCDYVLAAHSERVGAVNAGVLVLKPNVAMHDMLIRESHNTSNFDQGMMEQSFLNYIFRPDGPFPPTQLDGAWNGNPERPEEGQDLYIVHTKLWYPQGGPDHWQATAFEDTWADMCDLYSTDEFVRLREEDERLFNEL